MRATRPTSGRSATWQSPQSVGAAVALDAKVLDAQVTEQGAVTFAIADQQA